MAGQATPECSRGLRLRLQGRLGEPLELRVERAEGIDPAATAPIKLRSASALQAASDQALDKSRLQTQLGRLGGTCWRLEQLELALEGALFLPLAQLNKLSRDLVEALAAIEPGLSDSQGALAEDRADFTELLQSLSSPGMGRAENRNRRWLCLCAALSNCEPCARPWQSAVAAGLKASDSTLEPLCCWAAPRQGGGNGLPAHAPFPDGALPLLRLPIRRTRPHRLRQPLRTAHSAAA